MKRKWVILKLVKAFDTRLCCQLISKLKIKWLLTKSEISTPTFAHFSTKQWEPVLGEKIFFKKNVWQPDFRHSLPSCFSEREIEIIQESIKVELHWAQNLNICWRRASKFVQYLLKESFIFVEYLFSDCRRRAFIFVQYLFKIYWRRASRSSLTSSASILVPITSSLCQGKLCKSKSSVLKVLSKKSING